MSWKRRIEPYTRPLFRFYARTLRGLTLGVRGLVMNGAGQVLLIKHTYLPGWYMPGGGVEYGETAEEALSRELIEEAGVRMTGRAALVSFHSNHEKMPGDHVLIYRVGAWEACEPTQKGEIEEIAWFAPGALPEDVTPATRRRLMEALEGEEPHPHW